MLLLLPPGDNIEYRKDKTTENIKIEEEGRKDGEGGDSGQIKKRGNRRR